jgi:hypothetical protein
MTTRPAWTLGRLVSAGLLGLLAVAELMAGVHGGSASAVDFSIGLVLSWVVLAKVRPRLAPDGPAGKGRHFAVLALTAVGSALIVLQTVSPNGDAYSRLGDYVLGVTLIWLAGATAIPIIHSRTGIRIRAGLQVIAVCGIVAVLVGATAIRAVGQFDSAGTNRAPDPDRYLATVRPHLSIEGWTDLQLLTQGQKICELLTESGGDKSAVALYAIQVSKSAGFRDVDLSQVQNDWTFITFGAVTEFCPKWAPSF